MISAELLRKYAQRPDPFTIHLADGRKIPIPHGHYISVRPEGRVFLIWKPDGDVQFVNLTMVTALEGKELPEEPEKASPSDL